MCALPTGSFEGASCQLSDEAMSAVGSGRAFINVTTATAPTGGVSHLLPLLCPAMPSCRVGLLALGRDGTPFVLLVRSEVVVGTEETLFVPYYRDPAGTMRGQVVVCSLEAWNYSQPLHVDLSGGSNVPPTPTSASASGVVLLARDGLMAMAFLSVTGASLVNHSVTTRLRGPWWAPTG